MPNLSQPAAELDQISAQHNFRQTWIAALFLAALAGLAFTLIGATQWLASPHCRLHPRPTLMHWEQAVTGTSRRGAPCLIAANNSDARVEALEVVTWPSNGWIARRGKATLVYFPNSEFRGVDSLELKLVRRTDTSASLTTRITMRIKVD